jgi:hypothetical protein
MLYSWLLLSWHLVAFMLILSANDGALDSAGYSSMWLCGWFCSLCYVSPTQPNQKMTMALTTGSSGGDCQISSKQPWLFAIKVLLVRFDVLQRSWWPWRVPALHGNKSNKMDYEQTRNYFLLTYSAMNIMYVGSLPKGMRMYKTIGCIIIWTYCN